jgi:hypothetical protein
MKLIWLISFGKTVFFSSDKKLKLFWLSVDFFNFKYGGVYEYSVPS